MEKLLEKTCAALEDLERSGRVNIMDNADRKIIAELVDLKKNLLKVEKLEAEMDEEGYSGFDGMRNSYGRGSSYMDGNDGWHSERRGTHRDSMGRYSRSGYSMSDGKNEIMQHIDKMMETATDERTRDLIQRFRDQMERG